MSTSNPIGLLTEQDIARLADLIARSLVDAKRRNLSRTLAKEALSTEPELSAHIANAIRTEMEIETGKRLQGDRDTVTGQYVHGFDAMCACGHTMGQHLASGPVKQRACVSHELDPKQEAVCGCEGFRKAKAVRS